MIDKSENIESKWNVVVKPDFEKLKRKMEARKVSEFRSHGINELANTFIRFVSNSEAVLQVKRGRQRPKLWGKSAFN